jgi:hypothetical protein
VAAADGEDPAEEDAAGEPVAEPPDGVLAAGLDDPPHAATSAIMVTALAAQPTARSGTPVRSR